MGYRLGINRRQIFDGRLKFVGKQQRRIGFHDVCNKPTSRTLLFLPLAHVFARFIGVLTVPANTVLGHTPDTATLLQTHDARHLVQLGRTAEEARTASRHAMLP